MQPEENEERLLRSVALQNSRAVMFARERAERELLKTKEELQEAHRRISNILESITDAFTAVDKEWRITFINHQASAIVRPFNLSREGLVGSLFWDVFPGLGELHFEDRFREAMRSQVTAQFESYYPQLGIWLDVRAYPSPDGLSFYFQDVTPRKRSEEALRQQHEWFAVTLASIGDAVITTDTEGRVTFLNPIAEAMTGWPSGEAEGRSLKEIFNIVNEGTGDPCENPVETVLREGKIVGLANHTRLISRSGTITSIDDSAAPIKDGAGVISGVVMVFHDVTERRRAEVAQRESEERFAALVSASAQIVWLADPTGGFAEYSPSWHEYTGQTFDEMKGWGRLSVVHPDHREVLKQAWARAIITKSTLAIDYQLRHVSGEWRWTTVRAVPLLADDASIRSWVGMHSDIHARKEIEESLRQSEERLRATFNQAAVGIAIASLEGYFLEANEKFCEILGYPVEELREHTFADLTYSDDLPATQQRISRLRAGEVRDLAYEKRYVRKDGSPVWSFTTITLLKDSEGRPRQFIGVIEDISARKKIEAALRESEDRFRTAFFSAGVGVVITDPDGTFIDVNPAYCTLTGYSYDELRQTQFQNIIHPEDREENMRLIGEVLEGVRVNCVVVNRYLRKDGEPVWAQKSISLVRDAENRPLRIIALVEDISERKRAVEELSRRVRLTTLRAEINAAIARVDSTGAILQLCTESLVHHLDAAFARIWMSDATGQILELRASAGLYTHLDGLHSRIPAGEFKIGRIASSQQPLFTNRVQDDPNISDPEWAKREGMTAFAGYPLIIEQRTIGVIALFARHSLTDDVVNELSLIADNLAQWVQRTRTEAALRESERKLAEANADLDRKVQARTASLQQAIAQMEEFSYSVSHDLRAPIRAIEAYSHFIRSDFAEQLPAGAQDFLEKISRNTARMNRLINDVLTLSRVARNEAPPQPVALRPLIAEILEQHPHMQPPQAQIEVRVPAEVSVSGDDVSLSQALSNLLTNAVKFVEPGVKPSVTIRSERIGERVRIWVEDNGIGIKTEHQSKLFGMFQRLSANPDYEGTGVGLAIVKKAVERMGGTVGVDSEAGQGSRFWIELLAAEAPPNV